MFCFVADDRTRVRGDRTPPQTRHKVQLPRDVLSWYEGCEVRPCLQLTYKANLFYAIYPIRNTQCDRTSVAEIPWQLINGHDLLQKFLQYEHGVDTMGRPVDIRGGQLPRTKSPSPLSQVRHLLPCHDYSI